MVQSLSWMWDSQIAIWKKNVLVFTLFMQFNISNEISIEAFW